MGHFLVSETFLQTLAQIQEHFTVAARIRQTAGRETVQLFHQTLFSLAARHISSKVRVCLSKVDVTGNFPYNSYDDIQKWQLKRISEIVDYAYENIPLYHKKYSKIGYKKGMIK